MNKGKSMKNRIVYIETYGCASNRADSQIIVNLLEKNGYRITDNEKEADYLLVNTCAVKHKTEEKTIHRLKDLSKLGKKIIIAGCLTKVNPERIKKIMPDFAGMLDPGSIDKVTDLIDDIREGHKNIIRNSDKKIFFAARHSPGESVRIIKISNGCLSGCSFCATKIAHGNLVSYRIGDIKRELVHAIEDNCSTIYITSQDNGCYGFDIKTNLTELLKELITVDGNFKIRVGMANPWHVKKILSELIKVYRNKKIMKFIHIPVQSGSNKVLKDMKRPHSLEDFVYITKKFRKEISEITIATDIIVGFPTETNHDFNMTLDMVKEIKPEVINISRFSSRPGTEARKLKQIDSEVIDYRSRKLTGLYLSYNKKKEKLVQIT